jgi:hypothetical protein
MFAHVDDDESGHLSDDEMYTLLGVPKGKDVRDLSSPVGGSRIFLTLLAASPDPLRESLYKTSVGNCYINYVWAPFLTLDPCGAQLVTRSHVFELWPAATVAS